MTSLGYPFYLCFSCLWDDLCCVLQYCLMGVVGVGAPGFDDEVEVTTL